MQYIVSFLMVGSAVYSHAMTDDALQKALSASVRDTTTEVRQSAAPTQNEQITVQEVAQPDGAPQAQPANQEDTLAEPNAEPIVEEQAQNEQEEQSVTVAPEIADTEIEKPVDQEQAPEQEVSAEVVQPEQATQEAQEQVKEPAIEDVAVEPTTAKEVQQEEPINLFVPQAAEPTVEQVQPDEEMPEDEIQGIDTLGLTEPRGNWLFKRIWWERSEERYNKIRMLVEQINELRMAFFAQLTELEKTVFDPFYLDIGFQQGELQTIISDLMARLEQERQKDGMLSEKERDLLDAVKEEREVLEQLERDARGILSVNQAANSVIAQVMDQKNKVSQYEEQAWQHMRDIARILSDIQARELYYKVDAAWRNIKDIHRYLQKDLQQYFAQLVADGQAQVERVKSAMLGLKEKGVDLRVQLAQLQEEEKQEKFAEEDEEEEPVVPRKKKVTWLGMIMRIPSQVLNALMWLPRMIWSAISSWFK